MYLSSLAANYLTGYTRAMNTQPARTPEDCLRELERAGVSNRVIAAQLQVHEVSVSRWRSGVRVCEHWRHVDRLREMVAGL